MRDRRVHARVSRLLPVRFEFNGEVARGMTVNVSQGGAFVNTSFHVPAGEEVELAFSAEVAPEAPIKARVRAVHWTEPGSRLSVFPGIGVQWLQFTTIAGARDALAAFLRDTIGFPAHQLTPERFEADPRPGIVRFVVKAHLPEYDSRERRAAGMSSGASDAMRGETRDRTGELTAIRSECVYESGRHTCTGLAVRISERQCIVATLQAVPEAGAEVAVRFPLSGPFRAHWVNVHGAVRKTKELDRNLGSALLIDIDTIDEQGSDGVYARFLAFARAMNGR